MATYVHAPGVTNIYHWCTNCQHYPRNPQGATTTRPTGKLCDQCKEKEAANTCQT